MSKVNPGALIRGGYALEGVDGYEMPVVSRYDKDRFFERLGILVDKSRNYNGELDVAFSAAERVEVVDGGIVRPVPYLLDSMYGHQHKTAVSRVQNGRLSSAVIEAAHVYEYQSLEDGELLKSLVSQCRHATLLTKELRDRGVEVRQVLFIDDYNPDKNGNKEKRLDLDALMDTVCSTGYSPDLILREAAMVSLAKNIMEFMHTEQGLLKTDDEAEADSEGTGSRILLSRRNIELYRTQDDMVTCSMLDAALTILKFRYLGEAVINILPRRSPGGEFSYNGQQKKMRTIIQEHLNVRVLPIINLFVGDKKADKIEVAAGAHHALRKRH